MPWSCRIPDGRILLEAFTPRACLEQYSYERLELLGDAFLKLAASLHLFRRFPRAHEGGQGPWPEPLGAALLYGCLVHGAVTAAELQLTRPTHMLS